MGILKEFREFAIKGNFLDLAVGVIIGAASGKVVNALVEKVIMPPIGLVTGRVNFMDLKIVLQQAAVGADGKEEVKEVAIGYGAAIQAFFESSSSSRSSSSSSCAHTTACARRPRRQPPRSRARRRSSSARSAIC